MKAFVVGFTLAAALGTLAAWNETPDGSFNWNIFAAIVLWGTFLFTILVSEVLERRRRRRSMFSTAIRPPWWARLIVWVIGEAVILAVFVSADVVRAQLGICEGSPANAFLAGSCRLGMNTGLILLVIFTIAGAISAWRHIFRNGRDVTVN